MTPDENRRHGRRPGPRRSQAAEDLKGAWRRNPGALVLLGLVLLLVVGVGLSQAGGGEAVIEDSSAEETATSASEGDPFVESCVESWNKASDQGKRGTASFAQFGKTYASVGPAQDFPDQCLVTVTSIGTGGPVVQQWSGQRPGPWVPGGNPPLDTLSAETKDWNVTVNPDGTLSYP
jgi:hypothetical protein